MMRAREDGKTVFFSKQEPDKLFTDGVSVPLVTSQEITAVVEYIGPFPYLKRFKIVVFPGH